MNGRSNRNLLATAVMLAALVALAAGKASAQPARIEGKPDLNGVWQAIGTAHWDIQDHPAAFLAAGGECRARS